MLDVSDEFLRRSDIGLRVHRHRARVSEVIRLRRPVPRASNLEGIPALADAGTAWREFVCAVHEHRVGIDDRSARGPATPYVAVRDRGESAVLGDLVPTLGPRILPTDRVHEDRSRRLEHAHRAAHTVRHVAGECVIDDHLFGADLRCVAHHHSPRIDGGFVLPKDVVFDPERRAKRGDPATAARRIVAALASGRDGIAHKHVPAHRRKCPVEEQATPVVGIAAGGEVVDELIVVDQLPPVRTLVLIGHAHSSTFAPSPAGDRGVSVKDVVGDGHVGGPLKQHSPAYSSFGTRPNRVRPEDVPCDRGINKRA